MSLFSDNRFLYYARFARHRTPYQNNGARCCSLLLAAAAACATVRPVGFIIRHCDHDVICWLVFCGHSKRQMPFSCTEIGLPTYSSTEPPKKVLGGVRGVNGY